jgi:threonine dehydrogenase-like Zn-dependent dehydrogenase
MSARLQQRAATLIAPQTVHVTAAALPSPDRDEVRVRLEGCGICASNLPVWEGRPWFEYPRAAGAPGHEGWGVVDAVGPGVRDLQPGERVALISGNAYAEFDIAPRAAVVQLPDDLDALPFPGEPLGCAMNIFERSDVRSGHTVAIVGAGFMGLLLTQLASRAGAHVTALSRRDCALRFASVAGAEEIVQTDESAKAVERALQLTAGRGFDRVIETGGLQSTLDLAGALVAEYGRLIIAGYNQDGLRTVDLQQWNWRAIDVVNAHERSVERYASGVRRAIAAVLDGRLDPFPLLTHEVPLAALGAGFHLAQARPEGFMKAWVRVGCDERAA